MAIPCSRKSFKGIIQHELKTPCENYVKSLCGHFIRVIRGTVYLVHQTAREFLLRREGYVSQTAHWQHSFSMYDAEAVLLSSCVFYLLLLETVQKHPWEYSGPVFESWERDKYEHYRSTKPFFKYAATFWPDHFKALGNQLDDKMISSGLKLCDPLFSGYSIWPNATSHMMTPPRCFGLDLYENQLQLAIHFDLDQLVLKLLQEPKINPDMDERAAYQKALHLAAALDSAKVALWVLEQGADIEAKDDVMRTALYIAVQEESEEAAKVLLEHEANVEAVVSDLVRPLHIAAENNSIRIIRLLVDFNANLKAKDRQQRTPLDLARMSSSITELLHENDFDINAKDDQSRTPLHLAARVADGHDLRFLLAMGADVTLRDERGDKPINVLRRQPTIENFTSDLNRLAEHSTLESDDNSNVGGDSGDYDGYDSYDSDGSDCGGSDDDDAW